MKRKNSSSPQGGVRATEATTLEDYEEGLCQVTGWPGAKVRQRPFVFLRIGQRVMVSGVIILKKRAK